MSSVAMATHFVCRELVAKRQEAQALVQEMECTAEAFEEVQEQNLRLLQQIREKDDANFKVSERENLHVAVCTRCMDVRLSVRGLRPAVCRNC